METGVMATTWIKPLHANKGKTIAQTIVDRTNYAKNPDKTNAGELITAYACTPEMADLEFLLSKKEYENITGRQQDKNILAYHIRQAFKPGEVTPELANQLGHELARRFTKNAHAFIVATHVDKHHIHNHIIFNSTTIDSTRKFRNPLGSNKIIRRISDQICLENGLSVIENPKPSREHYGTWLAGQKLGLLIDLQNSIKAAQAPGYAHWAKVFSLKQAANTLLFLQENGLTDMAKLQSAAQDAKNDFNNLQSEIHAINTRLEQIRKLQKHIGAYRKTRDVYAAYGKAKNKRKFYAENENVIETHKAAKAYFDRINLAKLPTIAALKQEYAALLIEKKVLYKDYHAKKNFMREVLTAQQNVRLILGLSASEREKKYTYEGR
jgi:hypothetical protein